MIMAESVHDMASDGRIMVPGVESWPRGCIHGLRDCVMDALSDPMDAWGMYFYDPDPRVGGVWIRIVRAETCSREFECVCMCACVCVRERERERDGRERERVSELSRFSASW